MQQILQENSAILRIFYKLKFMTMKCFFSLQSAHSHRRSGSESKCKSQEVIFKDIMSRPRKRFTEIDKLKIY